MAKTNENAGKKAKFDLKNLKNFDFNKTVDPVIAWSAYAGVLALSVILALIFWL